MNETSLNSFVVRQKDRSEIETICVIKTNEQQVFKNCMGIFAMSSPKIKGYEIYKEGEINGDWFIGVFAKNLKNTKSIVIILDNARSHKDKKVVT